eukprot:Awhi_evm1s8440
MVDKFSRALASKILIWARSVTSQGLDIMTDQLIAFKLKLVVLRAPSPWVDASVANTVSHSGAAAFATTFASTFIKKDRFLAQAMGSEMSKSSG